MKKNLTELLQNAEAEDLESLFEAIKEQPQTEINAPENKPRKKQFLIHISALAASIALLLSGAIILTVLLNRENSTSILPTVPDKTSNSDWNDETPTVPGGVIDSGRQDGGVEVEGKGYDASLSALARRADFNEIIWDAEAELPYVADDSPALVEWNGLSLSEALYNKLLSASENDLFAVTVKVKPDFSYTIKDYPYLPRLVVVNMNEFGFVVDNFVYSGYHQATDQHYEIAVMTKAQLASLRQNYEAPEGWLPFNFESGYFTTLPYPEEDIAYAVNRNRPATTPSVLDESDQVPATIQE